MCIICDKYIKEYLKAIKLHLVDRMCQTDIINLEKCYRTLRDICLMSHLKSKYALKKRHTGKVCFNLPSQKTTKQTGDQG